MRPNDIVERSGCYRCLCPEADHEEKTFHEGEKFCPCASCGEATVWAFVSPAECAPDTLSKARSALPAA